MDKTNQNDKNFLKSLLNIDSEVKKNKNDSDKVNKDLWVPDDQAETCFNCGKDFFGIFLRRHHCRICGNVFCKDCYTKFCEATEQERELKVCEYCKTMCGKYQSILNESLVDFKDINNKKNLETKLNDYSKNEKKVNENLKQFINIVDEGTDDMIKKKLNELFTIFANKTIEKILKASKYPNIYNEWFDIISKLTIEVITQVSPSFQDLKDSIDINDYVKVKTIPYVDKSLSRVIDGFAFQKNVCTKKMRTHIYSPKILLLDCGLDGKRNETVQMPNILTQEPAYLEIIRKKIESVNPQVILVNKNASHKFQEDFSGNKMNISLVTNVKLSSLNKIARCTKTYVLPSADLINKEITLGQCYQFRIEKIKIPSNDQLKVNFKANEYNLMIFEGCGKLLHSTIILSGPNLDELKEIKKLLREVILTTVRDLFLQKSLLYYFNVDIFQVQETSPESLILSDSEKDFSYGFDTQLLDKGQTSFDLVTLSMLNGIKSDPTISSTFVIVNSNPNNIELNPPITSNESEIIKSVYCVCDKGTELSMNFYSKNFEEEKPLGKLIIDLCQEREEKCKTCSRTLSNHTSFLYKENGRIMISLINNIDYHMESMLNYISSIPNFQFNKLNAVDQLDIFSYGYCTICKEIVSPLIKLPKELFNFSATKFFKHVLFNHNIKNFNCPREFNICKFASTSCDHYLFRDISRIFFSKIGAIRFSFDPIRHYIFKPFYQIENKSESNKLNSDLQSKHTKSKDFCFDILEMLKSQFAQYSIDIKDIFNESHSVTVNTQIENILALNDGLAQAVNQLFQLVVLFFQGNYESELKVNVSIKQIYKIIVQVKFLYNKISKLIRKTKIICFALKLKEQYFEQPRTTVANASNTEKPVSQSQMIEELKQKNEEYIKENELICQIDQSPNYQTMMNILKYHDDKHMTYSTEITDDNICSLISCLLTSDEYLERISSGTKIKLNEIDRVSSANKRQSSEEEEDLYQTSLLYDLNLINYNFPGITEDKVRQQLETCLLSDDKIPFMINVNFGIVELIEASFKEAKPKNETINSSNKINCMDLLLNLKKIHGDLDLTSLELKEIKKNFLGEIKSKLKFTKLKFIEEAQGNMNAQMTAFYPKQFEAMRILYCSSYEDFILSISRSFNWDDNTGGKSKANFLKSSDNKYILKCVNKTEFQMFIESGFHYFHHINKFLVHKMPSAMTKTLGAYKIKIKAHQNETIYCIVMENLFYGLDDPERWELKSYDLKGSKINRYISKKNIKPNQVLPDTNFLEDFNGEPLALDKRLYTLFKSAIQNDCLILSKMTVVDYSLLLIIIEDNQNKLKLNDKKNIKIGIIDYLRKYTWDKQLETVGKKIIHKFLPPTIINPNDYKKRFVDKICNYFIGV